MYSCAVVILLSLFVVNYSQAAVTDLVLPDSSSTNGTRNATLQSNFPFAGGAVFDQRYPFNPSFNGPNGIPSTWIRDQPQFPNMRPFPPQTFSPYNRFPVNGNAGGMGIPSMPPVYSRPNMPYNPMIPQTYGPVWSSINNANVFPGQQGGFMPSNGMGMRPGFSSFGGNGPTRMTGNGASPASTNAPTDMSSINQRPVISPNVSRPATEAPLIGGTGSAVPEVTPAAVALPSSDITDAPVISVNKADADSKDAP